MRLIVLDFLNPEPWCLNSYESRKEKASVSSLFLMFLIFLFTFL